MLLYKFRSVSGEAFRFSQDIFVNRRLYVPTAKLLNDPNEGVAIIDIQNQYKLWGNQLAERNRKNSFGICAMSEGYRSPVLWSHYADEHRGICLEIDVAEIDTSNGILRAVSYSNNVPIFDHNSGTDIREAFLNKTEEWAYEKEWRFITSAYNPFLKLTEKAIKRVLLGARFDKSNLSWLEFWLKNYTSARSVPIVKMKFASTDYALYEENEMQNRTERIAR